MGWSSVVNATVLTSDCAAMGTASETRPMPFNKADGTRKDHPMMTRFDKLRYLKHAAGKFQAVALPYGKDMQSEMILMLPDQGFVDFFRRAWG